MLPSNLEPWIVGAIGIVLGWGVLLLPTTACEIAVRRLARGGHRQARLVMWSYVLSGAISATVVVSGQVFGPWTPSQHPDGAILRVAAFHVILAVLYAPVMVVFALPMTIASVLTLFSSGDGSWLSLMIAWGLVPLCIGLADAYWITCRSAHTPAPRGDLINAHEEARGNLPHASSTFLPR